MTDPTYGETIAEGYNWVFQGELLHSETTPFQKLEVYEHPFFGRMLILDGLTQTTDLDEFTYHELLVHPALASRDDLRSVLVIGGGDGGTIRRVLEHGVPEVVQCEIDEAVTRVSAELMPKISAGALEDPRAKLVFDDGAAYARANPGAFDAILIDSTDPIGPAAVLSTVEFYSDCLQALRPGGVLVAQTGSPRFQEAELRRSVTNMASVFGTVEVYQGFVPTYPGALWSFTAATNGTPLSQTPVADVARRLSEREVPCDYYHPGLHAAGFVLPVWFERIVNEANESAKSASVS